MKGMKTTHIIEPVAFQYTNKYLKLTAWYFPNRISIIGISRPMESDMP